MIAKNIQRLEQSKKELVSALRAGAGPAPAEADRAGRSGVLHLQRAVSS